MEKVINWNDKELVLYDFKKSHANGGRLGKLWVEDRKTGRIFLVKSSGKFSYEPFSEKLAYIIGRDLGIDVLEYDIIPASEFKGILPINPLCPYVSICEKIDRKGYSITSIAEIKRAKNIIKDADEPTITNREVMYDLLPKQYIDTMLLFDAIIGNVDRHYGNVHVLRSKNGEMVGAPILDNGNSLLASTPTFIAAGLGYNVGKNVDIASTMESTHSKQFQYVESLNGINFNIGVKTVQILEDIQPVLDIMPRYRANAVKKYIVYRLHKYLGLIKHDDDRTKLVFNKENTKGINNEKEHT